MILNVRKEMFFLFVGRNISQKRKEISMKLFGIYEVLMIVKLDVLANLESVDLKLNKHVTVVP